MNELRIFIADDEAPARARLKELLADVGGEIATTVVGESANGLEVIEHLPGSAAQVLLLDIQMPGMGGIELARHLCALESAPAVIFITAHDRHAVEAFELNALDYLMKPVRAERLVAALRKALDYVQATVGFAHHRGGDFAADVGEQFLQPRSSGRLVIRDVNAQWVHTAPARLALMRDPCKVCRYRPGIDAPRHLLPAAPRRRRTA